MTGVVVTVALILSALLLTLVVPRVLVHWRPQRADPARALLLWQCVSVSGVLCALLAAPVAAVTLGTGRPLLLGLALAVSAVMLGRVLWSGHRVGTDVRRLRAEHRAMVDLLGERLEELEDGAVDDPVRVLSHPAPTAFCLPGKGDRIVLSRATVERLGPEELRAVLAHERAHLDHRHDLLLELFTVLHEAVPAPVRAHAALREVHLLAEVLADHRAADRSSAPALARALVAMVDPGAVPPRRDPDRAPDPGAHPPAASDGTGPAGAEPDPGSDRVPTELLRHPGFQPALGASDTQVGTRLRLLAQPRATTRLRATLTGGAAAVLALPGVLVLMLWWV